MRKIAFNGGELRPGLVDKKSVSDGHGFLLHANIMYVANASSLSFVRRFVGAILSLVVRSRAAS